MTLKIAGTKHEDDKPKKEDIYISFTDLYSKKQCWLEEKLSEGHRIFLNPKKGRIIQISLAEYR